MESWNIDWETKLLRLSLHLTSTAKVTYTHYTQLFYTHRKAHMIKTLKHEGQPK